MAAFGTDDQEAVCLRILAEGELQVGPRAGLCLHTAQHPLMLHSKAVHAWLRQRHSSPTAPLLLRCLLLALAGVG